MMTLSRHSIPSHVQLKSVLLAATACMLGVVPATAQNTVLGTIIVQADRSPLQKDQIGRSLTVVSSEQIERMNAPYMADVLRQIPGIAIGSSGSQGSQTNARIRGGESNFTLVMIDGVVVNNASDGSFNFGQLQVGEVERIEVLRGPQGAFWGSNAVSGVINIVTKGGVRKGLKTTLGTEFGTDGTRMGSVLLQYGQDNFSVSGSVSGRHTDGFNISSTGDEKDGADHFDANVKFRADVSSAVTLDGNFRYGDSTAETDYSPTSGDTDDTTRTKDAAGSFGGRWTNEDASWFQTARFSVAQTDMFSRGVDPDYDAKATRYKGTYQLGHTLYTPELANSEHTITGGYEYTYETYNSQSGSETYDRRTNSLVGEYRGRFENQFYLTAALRHDFNSSFADFTSYSLSGAWQIPDTGTRLHASVGTGAVNPTFLEQYYYGISTFTPNPNLKPERSLGWDIGVEQKLLGGVITLDATYFGQRVEDLIKTGGSTVTNIEGLSTRQGVELSAALDFFNGFTASGSYTYTDAKNADGVMEDRRPMHVGVINLAYTFQDVPLTIHGSANFIGATTDTAYDASWTKFTAHLPAFTELGAGLNYKVNENVEVYGRVTNILNTPNQTVYGYNTPGRAFYVGAKASF